MGNRTPNYKCVICNSDMYVRPSAIVKSKGWGFTCSKECGKNNRSKHTIGISNHQYGIKGDLNSSFLGDTKINQYGYVIKYFPLHNRANHAGYVYEHNIIMESYLGRPLKFYGYKNKNNEVCHHIDRNKANNSISNLQLMTEKEHFELHKKEDGYSKKAGITKSKFSQEDIDIIVKLYMNKTQKEIAEIYNVSQSLISNVIRKGRYCYGK